jgi:hypothetical protein
MGLLVCAQLISATVTPNDRDIPLTESISQVDSSVWGRSHEGALRS